MNDPGPSDFPSEDGDAGDTPLWIDRLRPKLRWLILLLPIAAIFAAGLPFGGWRSVPEVLHSTDPRTLLPGFRINLEPLAVLIPRWLATGGFAALIGAMTWAWRSGTPGFGFFAALAAFSLSLSLEIGRWFKPGQLPDFRDPLIAAIVAATVWRLLRFLPDQPVTPLPRRGPFRTRWRILLGFLLAWCGLGLVVGAACIVPAIDSLGYAPAQLATIITSLPEGRTGVSARVTSAVTSIFDRTGLIRWFKAANRIDHPSDPPMPVWAGAAEAHDGVLPPGRLRSVATTEALRQAIDTADPGDVILLQPGVYPIRGNYVRFTRPGTSSAPITLRSPRLGLVTLESDLSEALKVQAPHWRFENLMLRGVCGDNSACDNGFHIVGAAEDTVLHNLRIEDFNAQIKINGEDGRFPDRGRIEYSSLIDTHGRQTEAPVTPIDLVGASDWLIQDNLIGDFVKLSGNGVSYGAFAKGAGRGTIFNRNVILCEWRLRGAKSQTIGLSFGGGGTGLSLMRDLGRSGYEHSDGIITNNLIAFCSDDGMYLNRAANSVVRHNTLIGTSGIDVRYPESTAGLGGNIVDGPIRARDNGLFWGDGNETGSLIGMFLGRNPVRDLFVDPGHFDLRWRRLPVPGRSEPGIDLCGATWTEPSPAGAFQDFRKCGETAMSPN